MPDNRKVLVVGTTADYIAWLQSAAPDQALFLTDALVRRQAEEAAPAAADEIVGDLTDFAQSRAQLQRHLADFNLRLDGIVCYDCESMELAARLAGVFGLAYPSLEAVRLCRNKYLAKQRWQEQAVGCPRARLVRTAAALADFCREIDPPWVLKPPTGSGSELVFQCAGPAAAQTALQEIQSGIRQRRANRLYQPAAADEPPWVLAEEFVNGPEYSCDFIIEDQQVRLIRLTRKRPAPGAPFGTIQSYGLTAALPAGLSEAGLAVLLRQGAQALGISRAICMLDFLVRDAKLIFLEMTPRPGGDCLPFLLRQANQTDILTLALDFARHRPLQLNPYQKAAPLVGLRLLARQQGRLKGIETRALRQDPRLKELHLLRRPGHCIKLPPADYDSWLLGHIIFQPAPDLPIDSQGQALLDKLIVDISS